MLLSKLGSVFQQGSPEPHMPRVSEAPDLRAVVARARAMLGSGERKVAVLMPDRDILFVPTPVAGSVTEEKVEPIRRLFPGAGLNITVVSFTGVKTAEKDNTRLIRDAARCIPMLGDLIALAYAGQNVLVFEGHPTAFETVVSGSDVLLLDSMMLPFLQTEWFETARRVMPEGKILLFDRRRRRIEPVAKSANPPGWKTTEADGEASYVNCLLTTLAKRLPIPVELVAGKPVPDLHSLAVDAAELEWIDELPFRYEALNAAEVIRLLQLFCKWNAPALPSSTTFHVKLAKGGGKLEDVWFDFNLSERGQGNLALGIVRREA